MKSLRRNIALTTLLVAVAAGTALASPAAAEVGQLSFDRCFAYPDGRPGCDIVPLQNPASVAVSPDSELAYVAAGNDAVGQFSRGADGRLAFDGCVANTGATECADLPGAPIETPRTVAVSPDGVSVYAMTSPGDAVAHLFRTPENGLAYRGCLSRVTAGCTGMPYNSLAGAGGSVVSPDGKSFYVTAGAIDSVAHLVRSGPLGDLTFNNCVGNGGLQGCIPVVGTFLDGATDIAMSPDGTSVYVSSQSNDAVALFTPSGSQGALVFAGCWANQATAPCVDLPGASLDGVRGLAVSPDGRSLYVASILGNRVVRFARDAEGLLTYAGCLGNDDTAGCGDVPGTPLKSASDVAVSGDGSSVYVTSYASDTIAHFGRDADGALTYRGCVAQDNADGQGCSETVGRALDGPAGLAVSPGGESVYVAAESGHAVTRLSRALTDDPPPAPVDPPAADPATPPAGPTTPPGTPASRRVTCQGQPATIVGTRKADRLRGTRGRDVIAALGGHDRVSARGGPDLVCGGPGRDRLRGGSGRDACIGGGARDRATGCERRRSL